MLPSCQPLPVIAKPRPFDGVEWIFELKYDGFRALALIEHGRCRLVSRNGHEFSSFGSLASSLAGIPHEGGVILDGEVACVDVKGRPRFNDLLFRRREPCFFAFDLLYLNGNDGPLDSLSQRKLALSCAAFNLFRTETAGAEHMKPPTQPHCGISICSDCRTECCRESLCDYCYDYHVTYSCLRKEPQTNKQPPARDRNAA
jgi:hypothetical protein